MTLTEKFWLIGLLEGEAWFGKGPPSVPNRTIVELKMTDLDTVKRAASLMGTVCLNASKREQHHKDLWIARVTGAKARELMRLVYPEMIARRKTQIDVALSSFDETAFIRSYFDRSKVDEKTSKLIYEIVTNGASFTEAALKARCPRRSAKTAFIRYQRLLDLEDLRHEA